MTNKDKDFLNEIKEELNLDSIELPESLKAESIARLVKDEPMKKKKNKAIFTITAVAASLAIAFGVGIVALNNYEPKVEQIPATNNLTDDVYTGEYADIQSFFKSLRKKEQVYAVSDTVNGFNLFSYAEKTESAIDGDFNGNIDQSFENENNESSSYNKTDLQVEGVLEADIVKNDGKYLYIVHQNDPTKILIVDTTDPKDLKTVAKIKLPEDNEEYTYVSEIFISGDKLIALTNTNVIQATDLYRAYNNFDVCYFCGSAGSKTGAIIYDISKKNSPKKITDYSIDGGYVTTRLVDNQLIIVSNYVVPLFKDDKELEKACIPSYYINGKENKISATDINIVKGNEENTYTVILKIDISKKDSTPNATAILGGANDVYCSKTDLYISRGVWHETNTGSIASIGTFGTCIYRFDFTQDLKYKASVELPGGILNQFSMDEYNGYFRVATSESGVQSFITVLDKELNIIGQLKGIAPEESIYAVRFIGDTAYVVTFYQTDPLFVIDLSNPKEPKIVGELKIPGFSNMLFPYSDTLLIGIGIDGNEFGANGRLKISLFDISDKKNPKEISKAVISGDSYTPAQYDHKAFMRFTDTNEFAIPITNYDYQSSSQSQSICSFKIENNKISECKKYTTNTEAQENMRSAYVGNTVFAISGNNIFSFERESTDLLENFKMLEDSEMQRENMIYLY